MTNWGTESSSCSFSSSYSNFRLFRGRGRNGTGWVFAQILFSTTLSRGLELGKSQVGWVSRNFMNGERAGVQAVDLKTNVAKDLHYIFDFVSLLMVVGGSWGEWVRGGGCAATPIPGRRPGADPRQASGGPRRQPRRVCSQGQPFCRDRSGDRAWEAPFPDDEQALGP